MGIHDHGLAYPEQFRMTQHPRFLSVAGESGAFIVTLADGTRCFCIASDGMGWEHVSISLYSQDKCPSWEQMAEIKRIFWPHPEACVVEFHPPMSVYVDHGAHVLHLWRPTNGWPKEMIPPATLVGNKMKEAGK